ncbi:high-affinity choline transporter 1-like [Lingula anatina]|uniref:High-affinity choline transporter 1-like n=1 Tax=Lingula anatina TaxID=7574 RepID=A0A1S3JD18_LINAN|nr:high-affinity choline transporter 1-like [Lingula anatina]|eukprot:XP_013408310.1 high-affinity choline transporter 1-like [Lingula anatina]
MAVHVWGLVAIIVFYLLIFILGIWAARKNKKKGKEATSEDILLAGRNIGTYLGIFTLTATWVDGALISGVAEGIYTSGLSSLSMPLGYCMSTILAAFFFVKKMREGNNVTMLDPFDRKFGKIMTGFLFLPALSGDMFWCAATLSSLGTTLTVVVGLDHWIAITVSAAVVLIYTLFGGLYSVSYTDVMQMLFIFVGLWLAIPFALSNPLMTSLSETTEKWVGTLPNHDISTYIDILLQLMFGGIPWQVLWQRALAMKSSRLAEVMLYAGALGFVVCTIPPLLIGMVAVSVDWNATAYDGELPFPADDLKLIAPLVLQYVCPFVVSLIGLGAISAAVMSSADSILLSSSSMFSNNIYKPARMGKASERELIWAMRVFMTLMAILTTVLAIEITSIFALAILCSDLVYVILFPQFTSVLFVDGANIYGSIAGYVLGLIIRVLSGEPLLGLRAVLRWPWYEAETDFQPFPYRTGCMLLSFLTILLVSYVTNVAFLTGWLPRRYDVLNGIVWYSESKPKEPSDENWSAQNEKNEFVDLEILPRRKMEVNEAEDDGSEEVSRLEQEPLTSN